jgi:hypothetical protein
MYVLAHFGYARRVRYAGGGDSGPVRRNCGTNGVVSGCFRVVIGRFGRWWGIRGGVVSVFGVKEI